MRLLQRLQQLGEQGRPTSATIEGMQAGTSGGLAARFTEARPDGIGGTTIFQDGHVMGTWRPFGNGMRYVPFPGFGGLHGFGR